MSPIRRLMLPILFLVMAGSVTADYTGNMTNNDTISFGIDGETHELELNFLDGGADLNLDGAGSEYYSRISGCCGLYPGDTFTANGVTVEVEDLGYDRSGVEGWLEFRAYQENGTKRVVEGQENQFRQDGETHRVGIEGIEDGPVIRLNDETSDKEMDEGDTFSRGGAGVSIVDYGELDDGTPYMEYRTYATGQDAEDNQSLGDVNATCDIIAGDDGYEGVAYNLHIPDYSNYRDLKVYAKAEREGEEYVLMEADEELGEGQTHRERDISVPTPLAEGEHEVRLEVVNDVGSGSLNASCGTIDGDRTRTEIVNLGVDISSEDRKFTFRTNAEAQGGIREIRWDLNGDNQFERKGRSVSKIFPEGGQIEVSVKAWSNGGTNLTNSTSVTIPELDEIEESSLVLDRKRVENGESIVMEVMMPEDRAQRGYRVSVEDKDGEEVWSRKSEEMTETFKIEIPEEWSKGYYDVALEPQGGILDPVMKYITDRDAYVTKSFRVSGEMWKKYCSDNDYDVESLEGQINCIRNDIVPEYFQDNTGENTGVAESLCTDLLSMDYSSERARCVEP